MKNFYKVSRTFLKKRSYTVHFKTAPGNKNFKGVKFISVAYLKGVTIYEEREKLYKVVKMLEVRPKRTVNVKWDFDEMVRLLHILLKHNGKYSIFKVIANDLATTFYLLVQYQLKRC
jgi:hypothetical protein